ncbi:bifunctional 2-polyprenyl-6-hydroxyphenol methylase/3-demethylubiquinol 3-O-methyltransferase UbiG [Sphingomonas sp.]|uniref:class I SAM-dependent methyltransferase n=1 Tax=Sphingomonas sp. TaxID=28214 RepID=UPI0025F16325|nr:class I SAM-dependent methyltransferase [Sphingomonas sp.]
MSDFRDQFYEDYLDFKPDWHGKPSPGYAAYFVKVQPLAALPRHARVLEIGFGDGQLLRWCTDRGHDVTGVEIVEALVTRARDLRIDCLPGPLTAQTLADRQFDSIVAFDVLEHMTFEEIADFFAFTKPSLAPGGFYLLRFPNGASPFGCNYQASDITHKSILSLGIMKQLAQRAGLRVDATLQPRPYPSSITGKLQRLLGYALQDFISWMLTRAYFGGQAHLEANLLVVLKVNPDATTHHE